jgi:nucleoside 2-deoxyribosyltransferase
MTTTPGLYLCGAINGCTDAEANDWRQEAAAMLGASYRVYNPMVRDYRGREEEAAHEIVRGDLHEIDQCRAVLVNATRPSWGTAMECFYAFEQGKTVVAFTGWTRCSPWLAAHTSMRFPALADACTYLRAVA